MGITTKSPSTPSKVVQRNSKACKKMSAAPKWKLNPPMPPRHRVTLLDNKMPKPSQCQQTAPFMSTVGHSPGLIDENEAFDDFFLVTPQFLKSNQQEQNTQSWAKKTPFLQPKWSSRPDYTLDCEQPEPQIPLDSLSQLSQTSEENEENRIPLHKTMPLPTRSLSLKMKRCPFISTYLTETTGSTLPKHVTLQANQPHQQTGTTVVSSLALSPIRSNSNRTPLMPPRLERTTTEDQLVSIPELRRSQNTQIFLPFF